MDSKPTNLWDMHLFDAVEKRWEKGRATYRPDGGPFKGDPLLEEYEELLDAINYHIEYMNVVTATREILDTLASVETHTYNLIACAHNVRHLLIARDTKRKDKVTGEKEQE